MKLSLSLKIILVLQVVFAFALALTGLLNYFKYEKAVDAIIYSRFVVVASGLLSDIENSVDLGLNISDNRNLQQLIDREKAADQQILSLQIFNDQGEILYATTPGDVGRRIPDDWRRISARSEKPIWRGADAEGHVVGATVRNSFKQVVGGLAVLYPKSLLADRTAAVRAPLLLAGGVALVMCWLVTALGVRVVFRNLFRDVRSAARRLAQALERRPVDPEADTPLGRDVSLFVEDVEQVRKELAAAAAAMKGA